MPRSKNPANYGRLYEELADAMETGVGEITLEMSKKDALHQRAQVYGYIYALEAQGAKLRKQGEIARSAQYISKAAVMRGYLIRVDTNGVSTKLRFINRDLAPATEDLRTQLHEQLRAQNIDLTETKEPEDIETIVTELDDSLMPPLDIFGELTITPQEEEQPSSTAEKDPLDLFALGPSNDNPPEEPSS